MNKIELLSNKNPLLKELINKLDLKMKKKYHAEQSEETKTLTPPLGAGGLDYQQKFYDMLAHVQKVRSNQKEYFELMGKAKQDKSLYTEAKKVLQECKKIEKQLDRALDFYLNPENHNIHK